MLYQKVEKILKIHRSQIERLQIVKKSIDARKKPDLQMVYAVNVTVTDEERILKKCKDKNVQQITPKQYHLPQSGTAVLRNRPVIVGAGPAGLFAAYLLASAGYRPLVLERGRRVEERTKDVLHFWGRRCRNLLGRQIEYLSQRSTRTQSVCVGNLREVRRPRENHI